MRDLNMRVKIEMNDQCQPFYNLVMPLETNV